MANHQEQVRLYANAFRGVLGVKPASPNAKGIYYTFGASLDIARKNVISPLTVPGAVDAASNGAGVTVGASYTTIPGVPRGSLRTGLVEGTSYAALYVMRPTPGAPWSVDYSSVLIGGSLTNPAAGGTGMALRLFASNGQDNIRLRGDTMHVNGGSTARLQSDGPVLGAAALNFGAYSLRNRVGNDVRVRAHSLNLEYSQAAPLPAAPAPQGIDIGSPPFTTLGSAPPYASGDFLAAVIWPTYAPTDDEMEAEYQRLKYNIYRALTVTV